MTSSPALNLNSGVLSSIRAAGRLLGILAAGTPGRTLTLGNALAFPLALGIAFAFPLALGGINASSTKNSGTASYRQLVAHAS